MKVCYWKGDYYWIFGVVLLLTVKLLRLLFEKLKQIC